MTARGLIIAAPHSGAGKTTVTLALIAALKRRGIKVHAAKAGPDYIDPAFHAAVSGSASFNLDSWAMSRRLLDTLAAQAADGADILVIEGVMGLFDGAADGAGIPGRRGATADLAAHFDLPVVLVLDVARQAQSAAAVVRGFATHDPAVRIAGMILNRVASERHRSLVADAIAALGIPILGALTRERAGAAGTSSRSRSGRRASRSRGADRPPRGNGRAPFRSRRHHGLRRAVALAEARARLRRCRRRGSGSRSPAIARSLSSIPT